MPTYTHLLDEDISAGERQRLGAHTLFTDALSTTNGGFRCRSPVENENHGGNASLEIAQINAEPAPAMRLCLAPGFIRGTQRTDTATRGSRSASEAAQPLYNLYVGRGSYRLRPDGAERSEIIFAWPPEIEAPHAYLLYLSGTERPLRRVLLIPASEAFRSEVFLHIPNTRPVPPCGEIRLERADTQTGETRRVDILVSRYRTVTEETPIRIGLRHV